MNANGDFSPDNSVESRATAVLIQYFSHTTDMSDTADIHFMELEALDWMNTSLGYSQLRHAFERVTTPGHRVILSFQNPYYNIHLSAHHGFVCTQPDGILPPAPSH